KHLLPLLAPNADSSLLRGPLSGTNALSCANPAHLHQMVHELGELLCLVPEKPATYQRRLDDILALVNHSTIEQKSVAPQIKPAVPGKSNLSAEADTYVGAEETLQKHCAQKWPEDFVMRSYCIDQQRAALAELEKGRPADVPENIFQQIRQKCAAKWQGDYFMQSYCEEEQVKSYRKVQGG
ncbi:MAG TPA: hypothetical protein VLX28_08480, partial [Thermoanaerobaculia bacterium]|nr:hypothetical protein [Thermoanaerobaculia bacterium]